MKKDIKKFKTPAWRKAAKDCVKFWEERSQGKSPKTICPLCAVVDKNPLGHLPRPDCTSCMAFAVAGNKVCVDRWPVIERWYQATVYANDVYRSTSTERVDCRKQAVHLAKQVLKIAKRIEALSQEK